MAFVLTERELAPCLNLPEDSVVDLVAELDLVVPDRVSLSDLLAEAVARLAVLAKQEGLPLSKYDREDLLALPPEHLAALARLCSAPPTADGLVRSGRKVYKVYRRQRPGSQVALILPMLLSAVARYAAEQS
jgi:hypothetical protein